MTRGRVFRLLIAALPVACTHALPESKANPACREPAQPSAVATTPTAPDRPRSAPNRCGSPGSTAPAARAEPGALGTPSELGCRAVSERDLSRTQAVLEGRYRALAHPSRVFISFECDPIRVPSELDLDVAHGERQELSLLRILPEGDRVRAVGLRVRAVERSDRAYDYRAAERFEIRVGSAKLERALLQPELDRARAAMAATIREVPLADFLSSASGESGAEEYLRTSVRGLSKMSTPDEPSSLREWGRSYLGPRSSRAQAEYLPLELAFESLTRVDGALAFEPPAASPPQDELRSLFDTSFRATFERAPVWLRELYLSLAPRFGSLGLAPQLAALAVGGAEPERVLAVNALAAVTGWDARFDEQGRPRDVPAAAALYAAECAR